MAYRRPKTDLAQIATPTEYWGLKAIAKRMAWSPDKVKRMAIGYYFPLMRLPARTGRGWSYYTNELLLAAWYAGLLENTRKWLLQGFLAPKPDAKGNQSTRLREQLAPDPNYIQPIDNAPQSCSQQVSSVQPVHDTSRGLSQNTSNDADLGGWLG